MPGIAIITEACIDVKACVDVCPMQYTYDDRSKDALFSEGEDPDKGHDHTFFDQLSPEVFAD